MQERIKRGSRIKDQDKYYKQQEILISEKTFSICKRLPEFCMDYVLAREVAVNSRYAYAQDLEIFFRFITESIKEFEGVKPNEITESDMKKINIKMLQAYSNHMKLCDLSANTRSRRLTSVRGLFKWLWKTDVLDVDCSMKLEMPTSDQREEGHVIHYLTEDQIKEFLNKIRTNTVYEGRKQKRQEQWTVRNYAIVSLFLHTGMRLSECVGLDLGDIDLEEQSIQVHRKGGRDTKLYMNDECMDALKAYLFERKEYPVKEGAEKALFISSRGTRITTRMVEKMVKELAEACGLKTGSVHSLRRSYGTVFYDKIGDVYLLAANMGHRSVDVTAKHYAKILDSKKKKNKEINLYKQNDETETTV